LKDMWRSRSDKKIKFSQPFLRQASAPNVESEN
jgi:hypothetical protein